MAKRAMTPRSILVPLLVALLVGIGAAIYALGFAHNDFSRGYVLFGLPGLLLWTGNAVGLLDGLKLSGISGITGSAACSAVRWSLLSRA